MKNKMPLKGRLTFFNFFQFWALQLFFKQNLTYRTFYCAIIHNQTRNAQIISIKLKKVKQFANN